MTDPILGVGARLTELLADTGLGMLDAEEARLFEIYFSLLIRWNARVNLTSVRSQEGILSRHFMESIACARALPAEVSTLLDFGSGGGFPGIPIAICRPEIAVTLAESQGKKAAFLQEAVRTLRIHAVVHAQRAENLGSGFDCVVLRAVDKMLEAVEAAVHLIAPGGSLVLMTTGAEFEMLKGAAGPELCWEQTIQLPGSFDRLLALGNRRSDRP